MAHPAFAGALCVVERESHASQGLAAASGHAEGEVAGIAFCGDSALAQYPCACAIHRCIRCAAGQCSQMRIQQWLQPGQFRPAIARSEEHTSELQPLMRISYAVFCLKKKNIALSPT